MPFVARNAFGGALGIPAMQANICAGSNERANNSEMPTTGGNRK